MSKVCKIEDYEMFDEQLKEILNGLLFAVIAGVGGSVAYLSSLFGNRKKFVKNLAVRRNCSNFAPAFRGTMSEAVRN